MQTTSIIEPTPRADATCALDGCGKTVPALARKHGDPFHATACARAFYGLTTEVVRMPGRKRGPVPGWPDEKMLHVLRDVSARLGRAPTQREWAALEIDRPPVSTVQRAFGSWSMFLASAGLKPCERWERMREMAAA